MSFSRVQAGECGLPCAAAKRSERGGVGVSVILVAVTLIVMGVLIAFMLQNYRRQQEEHFRKAVRISEYGLQTALNRLNAEPSWNKGIEKTPYDDGWYAVSLRRFSRQDTLMLEIKSEGHRGTSSDVKECLLAFIRANGDSGWVPRDIH